MGLCGPICWGSVASTTLTGDVAALVQRALDEDLGPGDVTSEATIPAGLRARAVITQKQDGVIYGLVPAATAFALLDPEARIRRLTPEGEWHAADIEVLSVEGSARALLAGERTAINLLAHLSGVATLTARCVREIAGSGATILDTRKTTPGLRALEKAAVAAGGATNHRIGLYDAILLKENHIAAAGGITAAVEAVRRAHPELPIEVEVRSPAEIAEAIAAGAPRLLLDNMSLEELRAAVVQAGGRASLEASGGVTIETLKAVASTGVQFISLGALTHSAPALDLSMILKPVSGA
jgi:nicotinate-nucleotide pyrophosphorylase (carboxylating)